MKLKVKSNDTEILSLRNVPIRTLVELKESMGSIPVGTVGYKVCMSNGHFFFIVTEGRDLGIFVITSDPLIRMCKNDSRLNDVPIETLVELKESTHNLPIGTIGYKTWINNEQLFVVIGGSLGVFRYYPINPLVQVIKSGTLTLEVSLE